jgi:hypothetical protein
MQWAAMSSGRVMLNEPRNDLARPVRELATTTASLILVVGLWSLVLVSGPWLLADTYRWVDMLSGCKFLFVEVGEGASF